MPPESPSTTPGKPFFVDVVPEAKDAGVIGGGRTFGKLRKLAADTTPAAFGPVPLGHDDRFAPRRSWTARLRSAFKHERRSVEDQFILTADLIEINERQAAFRHARDGNVDAAVGLWPIERRSVRRNDNFGACLGKCFDDLGGPDVFADRHADADAAHVQRTRHRPDRENALFVEDAVVRQIRLEGDGLDAAAVEQRDGVVDFTLVAPDRADQDGGAFGAGCGKPFQPFARRVLKRRLQDQIFRRIAVEEQLGEHDTSAPAPWREHGRRLPFGVAARSPTTGLSCARAILSEEGAIIPAYLRVRRNPGPGRRRPGGSSAVLNRHRRHREPGIRRRVPADFGGVDAGIDGHCQRVGGRHGNPREARQDRARGVFA